MALDDFLIGREKKKASHASWHNSMCRNIVPKCDITVESRHYFGHGYLNRKKVMQE